MTFRFIITVLCAVKILCAVSWGCRLKAPNFKVNKPAAANGNNPIDSQDPPGTSAAERELIEKIMSSNVDCNGAPQAGKASLRLLTREEFQNTARDVLKVKSDYRQQIPVDIEVLGFQNNIEAGKISDSHVASYLEVAIKIADEIKPNLSNLVQCGSDANACAEKIVDGLAPALWRRPLSAPERTELVAFYSNAAKTAPNEALTSLLARLLVSPYFLYRSEVGKTGSLTPHEMASALSYFFWGTVPDAELLELAKSGTILDEPVLLAQAERLMKSDKSQYVLKEFAAAWLGYRKIYSGSKSPTLFPQYTKEIQDAMAAEAENTFVHLMTKSGSNFASLFKSDYSIGSAALAGYYSGKATKKDSLDVISFADSPRRGVLGLGAILAATSATTETNPFRRGHFVLQNILCHVPPPTPEGLVVTPPAPDKELSTRERFARHSAVPACSSCHKQLDGVGFGMEDFDAVGVHRTGESGKMIDDSGTLVGFGDRDLSFSGAAGLSEILADSRHAKRCFVTQWYRYAHGHMEKESDVCAIRSIADKFESGEMTMPQFLVKLITHPSFQKRGN